MRLHSINLKLTLFTLAITTLSLISAGLLINQNLLDYHREVAQQTIQNAFTTMRGDIQRIEQRLMLEARNLAGDDLVVAGLNLINNYESASGDSSLFDEEKRQIGLRLLEVTRSGETDEAYLYNSNGDLVAYVRVRFSEYRIGVLTRGEGKNSLQILTDKTPHNWQQASFGDHLSTRLHQEAVKNDGIDYHKDRDGLIIDYHNPVTRTLADDSRITIGSLVCVNRIDQEFVQSATPMDIAFGMLDSSRKLLLQFPQITGLTPDELTRLLSDKPLGFNQYENEDGFYGARKLALQNGDWIHLVAFYPMSEYAVASDKTRRVVLAAILITGILVIPMSVWLLSHLIRRPMTALMEGVQQFRQGNYDARLQLDSKDELGDLASAMNLMAGDIRQREFELSAIIDQMPLMIFVKDPHDLRFVRINRAGEKILGKRQDEILGLNDYAFLPTDQAGYFINKDREALANGSVVDIPEERIDTPDGVRYLHTRKAVIKDADGRPKYLLGVSEDITERKQTEAQLRQWTKAIDSTSEGIMITDLEGTVLDVNQAFTQITGYTREEIIGQNPRILQSGHHTTEFYQSMQQSILQTGSWRGEINNRRKNGEIYPAWETISTVYNENNVPTHLVSVFSDISPIRKTQEKLDFLAHHDPLTGLPNRILLNDRMEHAIVRANRDGLGVAVMFLDLDRFKDINDSLGHPVGDELLQKVASRLQHTLREIDTISRQGGDEFVLVLEDIVETESLVDTVRKILSVFEQPFRVSQREMIITASLGISLYPDDGKDIITLIRNADAAMYRAKENGRNGFWFYTEDITRRAARRVDMEQALRDTVNHGELHLHYQPQLDLGSHGMVGTEALVRWERPGHGLVMPGEFIPLAEETGVINAIGEWVLYTACRQMARWLTDGMPFTRIAVNISPAQIRQGNLTQIVEDALAKSGLQAKHLELEVTEAIFLRDTEQAGRLLRSLDELGVQLALDDFGTGFSSLSYLKNFRFDRLKIDRSFIQNLHDNANDRSIANSIITLGHSLNMSVLAEGVETGDQLAWLRERGCDEGQGFLFSRPVAAEQIAGVVKALDEQASATPV